MGGEWVDQSIQGIGARLAHSLNRSAASAGTQFPLELEIRQQPFGPGVNVSACTINYDNGDGVQPCLDLFKIDAVLTLQARFERWSLLHRMVVPLLFVLIYGRGVATAAANRAGKTRRERYQVLFAIVITLLMTGYVAALVVTAVKTVDKDRFDFIGTTTVQRLVLAATALGLWKSSWVSGFGRAAVGCTSVIAYLGFGDRRAELVGQLIEVLDRMQEQDDVSYERIDVVAYSFGTIAAIDAFFPGGGPANRRLRGVNTLVTIGCPFDFVRTYWPKYFDGRQLIFDDDGKVAKVAPQTWLNFYEPGDILASNFRPDGEIGRPAQGIPTDEATEEKWREPENHPYGGSRSASDAGFLEFVTFLGLRSHSLYWGRGDEREVTVFDPIVSTLYAGARFMD